VLTSARHHAILDLRLGKRAATPQGIARQGRKKKICFPATVAGERRMKMFKINNAVMSPCGGRFETAYTRNFRLGRIFLQLGGSYDGGDLLAVITSPTRLIEAGWDESGNLTRLRVSGRYSPRYKGAKATMAYAPEKGNLAEVLGSLPAGFVDLLNQIHESKWK